MDYNFITRERFEGMVKSGAFLEWADVFGNLYGTGVADTEAALARGQDVVLVIDVQGARQVRRTRPIGVRGRARARMIGIFVLPPSFEVLEQRLRGRSKDPEEAIRRRLVTAREEINAVIEYDYVVVNDTLAECVDRLRAIVLAERARKSRMAVEVDRIVKSFSVIREPSTVHRKP